MTPKTSFFCFEIFLGFLAFPWVAVVSVTGDVWRDASEDARRCEEMRGDGDGNKRR